MKQIRDFMPESWILVLSSFAAAYGVGLLALLALPFLISAVINDLGLNEAQAGLLLSAEFVFTMLASLIVAPLMGRAPRRTLTLIGALIAISANVASASVPQVELLAILRCVTGIGTGLAFACGNACVSSARDPDKVAGYMNVFFVGLMIIVMLAFASAMASYGLAGLYYAMAITMAIMLLPIFLMKQQADTSHHVHHQAAPDSKLLSGVAISMMLAMFLFAARDTMGWAFVEQVGIRVGYDGETLGMLFSFQSFIGLIGPLMAAIIGKRFGMSTPVIIGVLACGGVSLGYVLGEHSKTMYTVAVMMISFTYFYALAYLTALAASLDKQGRVVAACGSFLTLGIALGPAISGALISMGGYSLAGWGIAAVSLATLIALMIPLSIAKERNRAMAAASMA
ncbi:MFS transporter [Oceanimonas doudoroffii]|uniref:MFS transporter n=1 Tax=Oceanimonas doudoroffii TaxID=84158 RepID=A0A233RDY1_9GAMM|nr:MFS transporter [Oceanimonas doudoroffii]OXY81600.1 MFS transporter [Oceanimonas doudoroffii]